MCQIKCVHIISTKMHLYEINLYLEWRIQKILRVKFLHLCWTCVSSLTVRPSTSVVKLFSLLVVCLFILFLISYLFIFVSSISLDVVIFLWKILFKEVKSLFFIMEVTNKFKKEEARWSLNSFHYQPAFFFFGSDLLLVVPIDPPSIYL